MNLGKVNLRRIRSSRIQKLKEYCLCKMDWSEVYKCKTKKKGRYQSKLAIGQVNWNNTIIKSKKCNRKTRRVYIDRKKEKTYHIRALIFIILAWVFILQLIW